MIIGTAGFSWSGSSAVSDFLMEFDENQVFNDYEFLLAYHPDGLEDLDYHLNQGSSKFLSSCTAIPRFRRVANYLLGIATKGKIKEITNKYLDSITQVKWIGAGQGQDVMHNLWVFRNLGVRINYKLFRYLPVSVCKAIRLYPITTMEFSIKPDDFYELTQKYTDEIFESLGLDLTKNIVLDQAFAGNNPGKSLPYFRDAHAILVDRDPRDLYVLAKKYYSRESYPIPYDHVEDFVCYFYNMHKSINEVRQNPNVLYVRFEEFVYRYEAVSKRIIEFLGLKEHTNPKKYFRPEMSMVNTQLYKKWKDLREDIQYIENNLEEFLFDFEKYNYVAENKKVFDRNPAAEGYRWK